MEEFSANPRIFTAFLSPIRGTYRDFAGNIAAMQPPVLLDSVSFIVKAGIIFGKTLGIQRQTGVFQG